jgi:hypothetical protein
MTSRPSLQIRVTVSRRRNIPFDFHEPDEFGEITLDLSPRKDFLAKKMPLSPILS